MRSIAAPLAALLVGSCVSFEREYPEKRQFLIDAPRPRVSAAPADAPSLRLRRVRVSPSFSGQSLVYLRDDGDWEADYWAEFFVPPDAMLTDELRDWLGASGRFSHVVGDASHARTSLLLESFIRSLYADFRGDGPPVCVLSLQLYLVDEVEGITTIRYHGDFEARVPAASGEPADLVDAWSRGLADVLTRFEAELGKVELAR